MERQVFEALQGTLAVEDGIRTQSEQVLSQLEQDTSFALAVANVAGAEEAGFAVRQAAVVQLRGYIGRHWSIGSVRYEVGPIPSQESKAQVRQKVFELITCNNTSLRSVAAAVVASMAVYDWPDEWPQLFSQLTELLHGGREQTLSALSVFSEWINGDMSEQQLDHIGMLIPDLRLIFTSGDEHSIKARVMAVGVFSDCIEIISNMATVRREFVDAHVPPILQEWMGPILATLKMPVVGGGDQSNIPLKTECIKALVRATVGLRQHLKPYNASIMEVLWQQIQDLQEPYLHAFVYLESEHSESATNMLVHCSEDGDTQAVDGYLCGIFEWISITAESKSARSLFVVGAVSTPLLRGLMGSLLCYMQITTEILADWADDLDLFVADEEDEGYRFSVRVSVQDLVQALATAFPQALVVSLTDAAQTQSAAAAQRRRNQDDSWWLASEAVLWTIDVAASELKDAAAQGGVFDLSNLLDNDVWPLAHNPRFPFGQGRAFVFVSSFALALPPEVAAAFVGAAAAAVADPQLHPGVRLSAVRATTKFCRRLPSTQIKPHLDSFIHGLASIVSQLSENSAHIALDALHAAVRVDPDVTASLEPLVSEVVMGVWTRYHADVLLSSLVVDIIEDLAANPRARDEFARRALPTIGSAISSTDDTTVIASAIDLLCGLIKGMPSPMPDGYTDAIFPSLMRVLSTTSDSEVQQCGQLCLKSLVQRDAVRLSQWRDEHGTSGLEFIFNFVAKLMSPEKSESAALFVGDLACKIAQRCTTLVSSETLAALVRTITVRLATARMASFSASLLPFYAQLAVRHPVELIDLLSSIDLDSRSGLHVVLSAWLANYLDVQGYYSRKVSAVGLMRLFALGDARIKPFMVQGDLISNSANNDKIVTRSMSRTNPDQYTTISAPAKIVKLLLAEMDVDLECHFTNRNRAGLGTIVNETGLADADSDEECWEDDGDLHSLDGFANTDKLNLPFGTIDQELFLNEGDDADFDDNVDDDALADPLYHQDLNESLGLFFKQMVQDSRHEFQTSIEPLLTDVERATFAKVCP